MDKALMRFFNKINFTNLDFFSEVKVEKVVVNKKKETWTVYLNSEFVLPIEPVLELILIAKNGIENVEGISIEFNYNNITNEDIISYFKYYLNILTKKKPSLVSLIDTSIEIEDNDIIVEVISNVESNLINDNSKKIIKWLKNLGFHDLSIRTRINNEKREEIKKELENTKEIIIKETAEENTLVMGEAIKGKPITIKEIFNEENNVIIEAYVFAIEEFTSSKSNFKILTLKVSDKTDSIISKIFTRSNDDYSLYKKELKVGSWYRFKGYVKNDMYAKDLVLNLKDIERIPSKDNKINDNALIKRVELHAHTTMSQMDGVVNAKDLIKQAISWGHKGIAITDHNSAQAFPEVYNYVKGINKGKEETDKFKPIYGVELNLIDDSIDIIKNPVDLNVMDATYCVFDVETTGFNAGGGDSIIEIGAVLLKNGEIIDTFDELINPNRPLPKKIIEITNITDEMLKDKDSEENVVKRFIEFFKDYPLVAHNAKFDISFLEMAYTKYDLGTFKNPVIDTLELSRALDPNQARHSLSALVKRYEIEFDETSHHRADYDADATAKFFVKMLRKVINNGVENIKDLNNLVSKGEIHKFGTIYHVNILVKNKVGLKNLFKLISYANTKYLYKTPRILRSELVAHREGLLLGSSCYESEVFKQARSKSEEELSNIINFYDFVEIQPVDAYNHLIQTNAFHSEAELISTLKKIVDTTKAVGKIIVASGDVHHLTKEDKIYREIIVNQKIPGGGLHPLSKHDITKIPSLHFRTTEEMLENFEYLGRELAEKLVIENPNKILDMVEFFEVIIETGGVPFSPKIDNSVETVKKLVYDKAQSIYGSVLPSLIEERIESELAGIIKGGYDVIYLIAHKLVKKSNEDGYLVGSRGSVGSSFVATLLDITEVNPLPPHYVCPKCHHTIFELDGNNLGSIYSAGYDLPDMKCPKCDELMHKDGHDMPFATFLGFDADKVPDIDLNFSGEYQAIAHNYTKELFGEDNVFRAGTIGTVAQKTAYGFVKGYCEDKGIMIRGAEVERLALNCIGVKRTTGQHPGGIVVIPNYMDIFDFTPYQYPADDINASWKTTHFEYHALEDDILKLDILGHDDPTILKILHDLSGMDVTKIPLDDKDTMSIFCSPEILGVTPEQIMCNTGTYGVPEFGTKFTIQMLEDTRPTTFGELVKISGLSHGTDVWLGNAKELIDKEIVPFKEVIGCRDDIMVNLIYWGMEPKKAFRIMEFVRKGKPSKDSEGWKVFENEMKEANIPDWYIDSCFKIKYMFPKAHAVAYVISAFRIAYFKVHYPIWYYSAYFSIKGNACEVETLIKGENGIRNRIVELKTRINELTNKELDILDTLYSALEMAARGFSFANIDIEKSEASKFIIADDQKSLIIPFSALDGLGDIAAHQVVETRKNGAFISIDDFSTRGKVNQTTIDKMKVLNIFNNIPESSQLSLF